MIFQHL